MATVLTSNQSIQHFSTLTGTNTVTFNRPINQLFVTTTGAVSISFDGGTHFMDLQANALNSFYSLPPINQIFFQGAGSVNGVGMAL